MAGSDDLGGLSAFPSEIVDDAASESQADPVGSAATTAANGPITLHTPVSRWTRPFAAAFLFGAVVTLVALAVVDRGSSEPVVFTHFEAVAVSDGISNSLLAGLDRVEMRPPVPVAAVRRVVPQRVTAVEPAETSFDIKPDEIVTAFSEPASPATLTGSEARNAVKDEQAVRQKLNVVRVVSGRDVQPVLSGSRGGLRDRRVPRHDDAGAEPGEPGTGLVRTSVDVQDAPRCWGVENRRGLAIFAD